MSKIYNKEYGLPSQYLLNKTKRPAKTEGKYLYYYVGANITDFPCGSKLRRYKNVYAVEVEVSSEEWDCLHELDREEYNSNHKEDRHKDAYKQLKKLSIEQDLIEEVGVNTLLEVEREIFKLHGQGYTQQEIAEKLNVTQSYISKQLVKIYDKIEENTADETLLPIERKVEKFWDEFIAKRKMPDYFDIIVDMFLAGLPSEEYERLLKWFYSYRELLRWILKNLLIYENKLIDYKEEEKLFSKLPNEQMRVYKEIFEDGDAPDCCKMTYLILATEVERRKEISKEPPKGSAFMELHKEIEKIAKLKNLTAEEYLEEYFIPEFIEEKSKRYASYRAYFEKEYPNVLVVNEDDPRSIEEQIIEMFGNGDRPVVQKKK